MKLIKRVCLSLLAGLLLLGLTACSRQETDSRTLDHFADAFREAGLSIEEAGEPLFAEIGATAGAVYKIGEETVKVYMYESEEALEKAKKDFASTVKDFEQNGRFLLETTHEKAKEVFRNVKK